MATASYTSKVTTKGQVTIPGSVRQVLGVEPGGSVMFMVDDQTVTLERAESLDVGFLKLASAAFTDWNTAEADKEFGGL